MPQPTHQRSLGTSNQLRLDKPRRSNGRLEHLRGSAPVFWNLTNYIARTLLETGGFRTHLYRRSCGARLLWRRPSICWGCKAQPDALSSTRPLVGRRWLEGQRCRNPAVTPPEPLAGGQRSSTLPLNKRAYAGACRVRIRLASVVVAGHQP